MRMQVTFKSGAQIEFEATEVSTSRSPIGGELVKFNWTTPDGWTSKLHTIEVGEIVAIVAHREAVGS